MKLEDIATFTAALEGISAAVTDVDPNLAAEALRFVLRTIEPPTIEVEAAPAPRALLAATTREPDASELAESIAVKLVAQSWNYASAIKAAHAAIEDLGAGEDVVAYLNRATELGTNTRRSDKEAKERHANGGHLKLTDEGVERAAAYVRKHKCVSTTDYAAYAGISKPAAIRQLRGAVDAGLIRTEGLSRATRYYPLEKEAA